MRGGEDAWRGLPAEAAAGGDGALPLLHDLHPHLRHQAPATLTPGPGTNVYFIAMFPLELQTKVGEYLTITIMEKAPTRAFSVIVETSLKVRLKL